MTTKPPPLLCIENFTLELAGQRLLSNINLQVKKGVTTALVGESGSGKSMLAKAILGLVAPTAGSIVFKGARLPLEHDKGMCALRGKEIAMVCQNPMSSLNPTLPIKRQLTEGVVYHGLMSRRQAEKHAEELLFKVGLTNPKGVMASQPDQLSGGMRQRVVIAMALACSPALLIADEPTTSLDVTIQAQILDLLASLQRELQMSILLISHDLGVVAGHSEEIYILRHGAIVDNGSCKHIFNTTTNAYTKELCWKR